MSAGATTTLWARRYVMVPYCFTLQKVVFILHRPAPRIVYVCAYKLEGFYPDVTKLTLRSGLCCRRSVCLSSVCPSATLVHPTQGVEGLKLSTIFLYRCVRWPSSDLRAKFYGDRPRACPRGTPPSGALKARGVSK